MTRKSRFAPGLSHDTLMDLSAASFELLLEIVESICKDVNRSGCIAFASSGAAGVGLVNVAPTRRPAGRHRQPFASVDLCQNCLAFHLVPSDPL
jgi:hypothetical protein